MGQAKATIDHDTIREWVEQRGGCPAHVKSSGSKRDPGILRIDYPGFSGRSSLEKITWQKFFDAFEQNNLAFLYQDDKGSRFSKLVSRDSVQVESNGNGGSRRSAGNGRTARGRGAAARGGASARGGRSAARSDRGGARSRRSSSREEGIDALELLSQQHREVEDLFEKIESARTTAQKQSLLTKLADALAAHSKIEETIFYPCVFGDETEELLRQSVEEHLAAKRVLADLQTMKPTDPQFTGKIQVLKETVMHHVEEEENELFPKVREESSEDLQVLGASLERRFRELMKGEPRKAIPRETRAAEVRF